MTDWLNQELVELYKSTFHIELLLHHPRCRFLPIDANGQELASQVSHSNCHCTWCICQICTWIYNIKKFYGEHLEGQIAQMEHATWLQTKDFKGTSITSVLRLPTARLNLGAFLAASYLKNP